MDIAEHNRKAWNQLVAAANEWTVPVTTSQIEKARNGKLELVLTPLRLVPESWLENLAGQKILCLASAGGQQGPLFAAAGADVTVFDLSPAQLAQDRSVAETERLSLTLEEGDMRDLSRFPDATFDRVFHPVSNCFIPEVETLWREAFRVLKPGGEMLAGFANPVLFMFCLKAYEEGRLELKYPLPYSDLDSLDPKELKERLQSGEPLEFGHLLEDQIGGQLRAGFLLKDFYEDYESNGPLRRFLPTFQATRAVKL